MLKWASAEKILNSAHIYDFEYDTAVLLFLSLVETVSIGSMAIIYGFSSSNNNIMASGYPWLANEDPSRSMIISFVTLAYGVYKIRLTNCSYYLYRESKKF